MFTTRWRPGGAGESGSMGDVLLQLFHWYLPGDAALWRTAADRADALAAAGFGAVWLPPAYKGHVGGYDVGYGVYDMYDLGEFDQKGTVATKYGTRQEYLAAIAALQGAGLAVYADVVWNHRLGADGSQVVRATPYARDNRLHALGPARDVQVWTLFDFAGRAGAHDARTLDARHFAAVDFDGRSPEEGDAIYLFEGKAFDAAVDEEYGNYHYLMGADLDHGNPEVRQMTIDWGCWYLDTTGVDGLRLDAVKHIPTWVLPIYLDALREHAGRDLPVVAEYWSPHLAALEHFLAATGDRMMLFDVPLHFTFHRAGLAGSGFDLRTVLDGSLVALRPELAVTFVDNHDSQPMQALESPVADWFKPLAYALVLLRRDGLPCVFVADYDGAAYTEARWGEEPQEITMACFRPFLDTCLALRRELGDAAQEDHFAHPNVIGWVRRSVDLVVVVLMSNGGDGHARIATGVPDLALTDATGAEPDPVTTDAGGVADVRCPGPGVSVWVGRPGGAAGGGRG